MVIEANKGKKYVMKERGCVTKRVIAVRYVVLRICEGCVSVFRQMLCV